ncbi:MAG: hypothetical protein ACRDMH_18450, partial [Solirubrobacterales bacterium]
VASIGHAGRAALRPGAELARAAWRAPAATPMRDWADSALESLDASGQRDVDRARARLLDTTLVAVNWVLDGVLGSPQAGRLMDRVVDSDEFWGVVERVLYSDDLLEVLARSRVGAGLAGQVANEARRHTVSADDAAERIARRILRRPPRSEGPPSETTPPARSTR